MTIYLFAGPNGSGKSTFISNYIEYYGLQDVEYICPDAYAVTRFSNIDDVAERYKKAMNLAEHKREKLLSEGKSMIVETVLSRTDKIDFILKARDLGYRIISLFIGTASVEINCSRVKKRVSEGGHDVPEEKIRARYARSMENLPLLADCSDELYVYDNSEEGKPILALSIVNDEKWISADAPDWVNNLL